jgi:Spy/CpxP family protein refolding chaperone
MNVRHSLVLPTAVLLVQLGSAIASAQAHTTPAVSETLLAQVPSTETDQSNQIPAPPWAKDLNLSREQRVRLKTINEQARNNGEMLHEKLMAAEKQLRSLLQSNASIQQLREQHQQVQQLRQQLDNNQFEALLGERQVLTSEQLATVIQQFRVHP